MSSNTISAIIIDDESFAIANLSSIILNFCPSITIIDTATNIEEARIKIESLKPDAVFLDINMPGHDGFDLLNRIVHTPSVIFVSAHEQYALRAMKVCAIDFLLKPINIKELQQTQSKLLQIKSIKPEIRSTYPEVLRNFARYMGNPKSLKKITLYHNGGYELFDIAEILYLIGEENYTTFHFRGKKTLMMSKTLKEYDEMLTPFGFMRIHKSTLINLAHVKKAIHNNGTEVEMKNGEIFSISRRKSNEFMEWMKSNSN